MCGCGAGAGRGRARRRRSTRDWSCASWLVAAAGARRRRGPQPDRGVPLAVLILVGFVVFFDVPHRRTRFGRHIFAVGGNAEAARRAGISRQRHARWPSSCSARPMAAVGGIMAASRLLAVNQSSGAATCCCTRSPAAVIARHQPLRRPRHGLVGAARRAGDRLDLQRHGPARLESAVKFMVTGAVLLGAVIIDALSRKRRVAGGRAAQPLDLAGGAALRGRRPPQAIPARGLIHLGPQRCLRGHPCPRSDGGPLRPVALERCAASRGTPPSR